MCIIAFVYVEFNAGGYHFGHMRIRACQIRCWGRWIEAKSVDCVAGGDTETTWGSLWVPFWPKKKSTSSDPNHFLFTSGPHWPPQVAQDRPNTPQDPPRHCKIEPGPPKTHPRTPQNAPNRTPQRTKCHPRSSKIPSNRPLCSPSRIPSTRPGGMRGAIK